MLRRIFPNSEIIGRYSIWGEHRGLIFQVDRWLIPVRLSERRARGLRW